MLECTPGESIRAIKNVTFNEPFFTGHFPERPVMPGVMILEALAQAAGILTYATLRKRAERRTRASISSASTTAASAGPWCRATSWCSRRKVERNMKGIWKLSTAAYVDDAEAASAEMMLFPDADNAHRSMVSGRLDMP